MEGEYQMLCHRYEYRAQVLEGKLAPRYECSDIRHAVACCYMYQPVLPVAVKPRKGEKRPLSGPWMLAGRVVGVDVPAEWFEAVVGHSGRLLVPFWKPKKGKLSLKGAPKPRKKACR